MRSSWRGLLRLRASDAPRTRDPFSTVAGAVDLVAVRHTLRQLVDVKGD